MCNFCEKAKDTPEYVQFIEKMLEEDRARMDFTKIMAQTLSPISRSVYASMNWPVKLIYPMFEARAAFAVPNNYFQNLTVDDERLGNSFGHGAMRSIFFAGEKLVVFSKATNFHDAKEFFTSFILLHLEKNEYTATMENGEIKITAQVEKPLLNLVTGKVEKKRIAFGFVNQNVESKIVSKEQATTSARFKNVYDKYSGAQLKSASIDMEGYAITVPHFSPHPYMIQLHDKFGFEENRELQIHVEDYFKSHLVK
ncbi:Uncharacterised protein [Candidatus Bilamarchaeum dharawalense]|uniref:Uncharacterized protein n=1 Tax=Candidatus Bilamarchaeum dharawalense TaxID=2885759 RepID=A0A5E4LMN1_9ARCH|nr:Uncharacterised protein [Candidatus Bilamarchaeum dharawalense]